MENLNGNITLVSFDTMGCILLLDLLIGSVSSVQRPTGFSLYYCIKPIVSFSPSPNRHSRARFVHVVSRIDGDQAYIAGKSELAFLHLRISTLGMSGKLKSISRTS